jgi:uncharacterized membrane protein
MTAVGTSGLAIASLVIGIAGWASCLLGGPLAIIMALIAVVLGHIARNETKQGARAGDGYAVAGLWLGYPLAIVALVALVTAGGLTAWLSTDGAKDTLRSNFSTSANVLGGKKSN